VFIIALQILNMSIDAPAAELSPAQDTSTSFNYIDTFVEYVAEVILRYDNAIPESKDRQQKELQQHKQFQIAFEKIELPFNFLWIDFKSNLPQHPKDKYAYQFVKEINPPPPKA
jgi:hypothetical protein